MLLEDIWRLCKGIWKVTCRKHKENLDSFMQKSLETLDLFEKDCLNEYLTDQEKGPHIIIDEQFVEGFG